MKSINFITTLSAKQQTEIRRWFIATATMIIVGIFTMVCYFAPQLHALYLIKKEIAGFKEKTKTYISTVQQKNTLKKEHISLQQKKDKIQTYLLTPHNPHHYLTTLVQLCHNAITIQHIRNDKKDIELTLTCPTAEQATTLIQEITNTGLFSNTKLTSLQQHDKNGYTCIIKSSIKK